MSSKELTQLGNTAYRDTLRTEIVKRLSQLMPKVKINTIYFSKYILQ
jgi:flagellar basal body-associated protein FliL